MTAISEAAYTSDVSGAKDASEAIMAVSESTNSGPKVTYAISEVINAVSEVTNAVPDANAFIWRCCIGGLEYCIENNWIVVSEIKNAALEAIDAVLKTATLEITIFYAVAEAINAVS